MVETRKPQFGGAAATAAAGFPKPIEIPGMGTLPQRPGTIGMTALEKKNLAALGWKEGDPIPPNLANLIAEQTRVLHDVATATPVPPNGPSIKMPEPIDISKLPIEKQKELQNMMKMFKEAKLGEPVLKPEKGQYSPSVLAAIESASKPAGGIKVVDSRQKVEPAKAAEPAATAKAEEPKLVGNCPRCNWDLQKSTVPEPTAVDILNYQAGMLGDQTFQKEYKFFGGRLQVIYRALTIQQSEQCLVQANRDMRQQPGGTFADFWRYLLDYRLCLALVSIVSDSIPADVATCVDMALERGLAVKTEEVPTSLPEIRQGLQAMVPLRQESIWRLLSQTSQDFNALVEKLEVKASDEGFYKPTGQAP